MHLLGRGMHSRGFVVDSRTNLAFTMEVDVRACWDRAEYSLSLQEAVVSVELLRVLMSIPARPNAHPDHF